MGKKYTHRDRTRRKLSMCANCCNMLNDHLMDVAGPYETPNPDIFEAMLNIGGLAEKVRHLCLDLRDII